MQSGDREPLEGIAEEPPTEESTANRNAANFAQELLDYSQELEELYSASESLGDAAPLPQTAAENADMAAAEAAALGAAETTAVSQEDVEEMCDKGRPILIQLVKAAVDAGPMQLGRQEQAHRRALQVCGASRGGRRGAREVYSY